MTTITTPGRITRDRADFYAHQHDGFTLLEPLTEKARAEVARFSDDCKQEETGWLFAEWSESPLEQSVAREIGNGWNVRPWRVLNDEPFARMLAAVLTGDESVGPDDVTEEQWLEALELATGRSAPREPVVAPATADVDGIPF